MGIFMILTKSKLIIIIISILIIIIPSSFAIFNVIDSKYNDNDDEYNFSIVMDKKDILMNEIFNVSIIPEISDVNITWYFGSKLKGDIFNIRYGYHVAHWYWYSDIFNITVYVNTSFGNYVLEDYMPVNMYNQKGYVYNEGFKVIPLMSRGSGIGSPIHPGLTDPTVILTITYHGTGKMGPYVILEDEITKEEIIIDEYTEFIFNDENICTYTFSNDEYDFNSSDYLVMGGIVLERGILDYWIYECERIYPAYSS